MLNNVWARSRVKEGGEKCQLRWRGGVGREMGGGGVGMLGK